MNDFTKEELIQLKDCCKVAYLSGEINPQTPGNLAIKLQSMIDNHCEHEIECEHDWGVGFGSIHSPVTYCKKCFCQKPMIAYNIFNKIMKVNK